MPKLPECDQCQLYSLTPRLVCAIHPSGPATDECLDFAPNAAATITTEDEELWFPGAASYIRELIPESHSRLTQEEQLELLATHPLFTGRYPRCGYISARENRQQHIGIAQAVDGWITCYRLMLIIKTA